MAECPNNSTLKVQAVCWTIGALACLAAFTLMMERCGKDSANSRAAETEQTKAEPVRLKAALEACQIACGVRGVRQWVERKTDRTMECVCE